MGLIVRMAAGGACLPVLFSLAFSSAPAKERRSASMAPNNAVVNASIPPIDRSAPARTETATFALG